MFDGWRALLFVKDRNHRSSSNSSEKRLRIEVDLLHNEQMLISCSITDLVIDAINFQTYSHETNVRHELVDPKSEISRVTPSMPECSVGVSLLRRTSCLYLPGWVNWWHSRPVSDKIVRRSLISIVMPVWYKCNVLSCFGQLNRKRQSAMTRNGGASHRDYCREYFNRNLVLRVTIFRKKAVITHYKYHANLFPPSLLTVNTLSWRRLSRWKLSYQ